jgi:outer membrane receptor protein involved in Fe transport
LVLCCDARKTTDWWNQHFLIGAYNERYTFVDPPIPTESFPVRSSRRSIYSGSGLANTFELPSSNVAVARVTFYLEGGHDSSFPLHEGIDVAASLQDQWEVIFNLTLTAGGRYYHYQYAGDAFTYCFTGAYYFTPTSTKLRSIIFDNLCGAPPKMPRFEPTKESSSARATVRRWCSITQSGS